MSEREVEPDLIDFFGSIIGFLRSYRIALIISLIVGIGLSFMFELTRISQSSGECIIRLGGAGNSYLTDVVLVLDKEALIDGLRSKMNADEKKKLIDQLDQYSTISFSVYQRSSIKAVVRYDSDSLERVDAEQAIVKALKNNRTVWNYVVEEGEILSEELNTLELQLTSLQKLSSYLAESPAEVMKTQMGTIFVPSLVDLAKRKSELQQLLNRIEWVNVVSPMRIEIRAVSAIKFIVLSTIVIVFLSMLICLLHNMLSIYSRRNQAEV